MFGLASLLSRKFISLIFGDTVGLLRMYLAAFSGLGNAIVFIDVSTVFPFYTFQSIDSDIPDGINNDLAAPINKHQYPVALKRTGGLGGIDSGYFLDGAIDNYLGCIDDQGCTFTLLNNSLLALAGK